jgi:hypothetical protein
MYKLSISRTALTIAMIAILLIPPTQSVAAPKWLQEMFTIDPPRSQKHKSPRRAKRKAAQSGNAIRLPATAPLPETAPRVVSAAVAPDSSEARKQEVLARKSEEALAPGPQPSSEGLVADAPADPPKPEPRPEPEPKANQDDEGPAPQAESLGPQAEQPARHPDEPVGPAAPDEPPIPQFRPDRPAPGDERPSDEKPADEKAGETEPEEPPPPPDPRSATRPDTSGELPDEEMACRRRLEELGVSFEVEKAESDESGCSMPYPITIDTLGKGITLEPRAEMNCAMAEAAARFAQGPMSDAARQVFGSTLKSVSHASAYVCRPRNGTRKLSEHAFGNALDIAAFKLSDGTTIAVQPEPPEKDGRFLSRVRKAACGPFKTVLGPGSDADHAEHFHFDLAPRRNGGTVCQ